MNYIQGSKFAELHKLRFGRANIAVYQTHMCKNFLDYVRRSPEEKHVLITHNSDGRIQANYQREDSIDPTPFPDNLLWFAQNVNYQHTNLVPIPIGLENSQWFPELKKIEQMEAMQTNKKKLLYINHNHSTHPARRALLDRFRDTEWATVVWGHNGFEYGDYLRGLAEHKFVLSPEGNGLDCHRTWEALYLDCVPIMLNSGMNSIYHDLALLVDDWSEVTFDKLQQKVKINKDKLDFEYWYNLIISKTKEFLND